MNTIDISNLDRGSVLAVLYNASKPLGMGFMHYDPKPMTPEEGTEFLKGQNYFDYLNGRVMKVQIDSDALDPRLYDRDNGVGAAAKAIATLRASNSVNAASVQQSHLDGKRQSAASVRESMSRPSVATEHGITLGLADVADKLGPKVNEAIHHRNQ